MFHATARWSRLLLASLALIFLASTLYAGVLFVGYYDYPACNLEVKKDGNAFFTRCTRPDCLDSVFDECRLLGWIDNSTGYRDHRCECCGEIENPPPLPPLTDCVGSDDACAARFTYSSSGWNVTCTNNYCTDGCPADIDARANVVNGASSYVLPCGDCGG